METKYTFWGKIYRYHGFEAAFWFCIFYLFEVSKGVNITIVQFLVIFYLFIFWGMIYAWFHPWARIEDNGILISRLYLARRRVKWNNIKLFKKVRTITRYGLVGDDPRYAVIEIKDGIIADRYITILPFFKDYDAFITEIEKYLDPTDVVTDKNYR